MSSFDSDNDFMHEDYYETNGNFYTNGVYQGKKKFQLIAIEEFYKFLINYNKLNFEMKEIYN